MTDYSRGKWKSRHRNRADISTFLTHLTKGNTKLSTVDVLIKILNEQKLIGSNHKGFIQGKDRAVCFQDAPIHGVAQNILHEQRERQENGGKKRYTPIGLMFSKPYVFKQGGRPVIYDTKKAANETFHDIKWRVVTMDLMNKEAFIDWTHEREWRVKGDFHFELEETYVILTDKKVYKKFIEKVDSDILSQIAGIVTLEPILS